MKTQIANNATSALASEVATGATSLVVTTGGGALFPAISHALEDFYVRLGDDAVNEVVRCTARSGDTLTCVAITADWPLGTEISLMASKETFDSFPRIIESNTTVTVKASGGDFTSLSSALAALQNTLIQPTATVTIMLDPGRWAAGGIQDGFMPFVTLRAESQLSPSQIVISGVSVNSQEVTGIYAVGGSAWNQDITLSLASGTDMSLYAAYGYVVISAAAGGTDPENLIGVHRILSVDVPNKRIVIKSTNKSGAPSGTVTTTTMVLLRTSVEASFYASNCFGWSLKDLAIDFNGAGESVVSENGATISLGPNVGVRGSVVARDGGLIYSPGVAVSVGGLISYRNGHIEADGSILCGCSYSIGAYDSGKITAKNSKLFGSTYGVLCKSHSFVDVSDSVFNNTLNDSIDVSHFGYVYAYGATTMSTTPAIDTPGNVYGYIDTAYWTYDAY